MTTAADLNAAIIDAAKRFLASTAIDALILSDAFVGEATALRDAVQARIAWDAPPPFADVPAQWAWQQRDQPDLNIVASQDEAQKAVDADPKNRRVVQLVVHPQT